MPGKPICHPTGFPQKMFCWHRNLFGQAIVPKCSSQIRKGLDLVLAQMVDITNCRHIVNLEKSTALDLAIGLAFHCKRTCHQFQRVYVKGLFCGWPFSSCGMLSAACSPTRAASIRIYNEIGLGVKNCSGVPGFHKGNTPLQSLLCFNREGNRLG